MDVVNLNKDMLRKDEIKHFVVVFAIIHDDNMSVMDNSYHFGSAGALRIGKALWWLLARIAGWDGIETD